MKKPWYRTVLVAQTKEVFSSAVPYTVLLLVLLLWRFALRVKFQWVEVKPLSEPEFFYRAFYSAFTFCTLGFLLYEARFYKVLHDVVVKGFGSWELYNFIKAVVWLFLMFLSYQYIVPTLFTVLNTSATILYNFAAFVLYVLPPVGISLVAVSIYVLVRSSQRKLPKQRQVK
ncbi:MAG: hypothetical protein ABSE76_00475 [Minisyncoccia bacterium]|jgi:hypothetical protein